MDAVIGRKVLTVEIVGTRMSVEYNTHPLGGIQPGSRENGCGIVDVQSDVREIRGFGSGYVKITAELDAAVPHVKGSCWLYPHVIIMVAVDVREHGFVIGGGGAAVRVMDGEGHPGLHMEVLCIAWCGVHYD